MQRMTYWIASALSTFSLVGTYRPVWMLVHSPTVWLGKRNQDSTMTRLCPPHWIKCKQTVQYKRQSIVPLSIQPSYLVVQVLLISSGEQVDRQQKKKNAINCQNKQKIPTHMLHTFQPAFHSRIWPSTRPVTALRHPVGISPETRVKQRDCNEVKFFVQCII